MKDDQLNKSITPDVSEYSTSKADGIIFHSITVFKPGACWLQAGGRVPGYFCLGSQYVCVCVHPQAMNN